MKNSCLNLILFLLLVAPISAQQTDAEFFAAGNLSLSQGKYAEAVNSFSECLRVTKIAAHGCYANRALAFTELAKREKVNYMNVVTKYDGVTILNATRLKAFDDINKAIQQSPQKSIYYFIRAQIYVAEEIYDKAYADYQQGFAVDPNLATTNPKAYQANKAALDKLTIQYASWLGTRGREAVMRSASLAQLKDAAGAAKVNKQAIEYFTKSLELDKTNYINWSSRGDVYKYEKNYPAAIADYSEAIKVKPGSPDAYISRAEVYELQKNNQLALADLEKVIAMPESFEANLAIPRALVGRAKIRFAAGQNDTALADLEKVLAASPDFVEALFYRGKIRLKKGNKPLAIADFKKALEIAVDYPEAQAELKKLGVKN